MAKKETKVSVRWGYGLGTTLFLIFMILKLTGQITWSWWWVTAPLWIPLGMIAIVLLVLFIGLLLTQE